MNDIITPRGRGLRPVLAKTDKSELPPRSRPTLDSPQPAVPVPAKPETVAGSPAEQPAQTDSDWPPSPKLLVKKFKRRGLKWILIGLGIFVVLLGIGLSLGYWWYSDNLQAKNGSVSHTSFKVENGETVEGVTSKLEQQGVIRSALAMEIYMKLNGKTAIKSGTYLLAADQTPAELAQWLVDGRVDTFKVTILPGMTLVKIKKGLMDDGYKASDIDAAFKKDYDHPLLAHKPKHATLEGYIYPETYFVTSDTTVEQLLVTTFDEFEKQLMKNDIRTKLKAQDMTLHEGFTLASIIEREVISDSDRRQVAQIFLKRLKEGMMLGSDVTYHYAASLLGVEPNPNINSPYNTRKFTGLPPGPIANFTMSALLAVVNPASGSYLYFVGGDDGNTYFAHTEAEHQENIAKYCHELCSRY